MTRCLRMCLGITSRNRRMWIAYYFFRVNSKTAFFVLKEAATHVTDGGKIISIVTALLGAFTGQYTSYAGSKAPVEHFTRYVARPVLARKIGRAHV